MLPIVEIIERTSRHSSPSFIAAIALSVERDRWDVGLSAGKVIIAPYVLWGLTMFSSLPLRDARGMAARLSASSDKYIVVRNGRTVYSVRVEDAREKADQVLPYIFEHRAAKEVMSTWLKLLK